MIHCPHLPPLPKGHGNPAPPNTTGTEREAPSRRSDLSRDRAFSENGPTGAALAARAVHVEQRR